MIEGIPSAIAVGLVDESNPKTDDLFPYQKIGFNWLASKKYALLADEPGLGKTVQAIRGLDSILATTALVICPSVARINWLREFEMWSDIKRDYFIAEKLSDIPPENHTTICSFDYAAANSDKLRNKKWDLLLIDEAHFLKSHTAKRTKAILGRLGVVRSCKRLWLLTGTPAPNHPGELWVPLYTFGVTKLSYDAFLNRYCKVRYTPHGPSVYGARNIPELRALLSKVMLRRLKKDVMKELPPIKYIYRIVQPGPVEIEDQASFAHFFFPEDKTEELQQILNDEMRSMNIVVNQTKAKMGDKLRLIESIAQSTATLRRYIGLQKLQPTIEIITHALESRGVKKVVLFCVHRDVVYGLRMGLKKFRPVTLYGGMPAWKRQQHIDKFQNNPKCQVFIGNIQACGTAITLTAAHDVFFVELDYSPSNLAQAVMRCHRIGQENPVLVRYILLDKSFDAQIGYILKRKVEMLTQIFD